MGANTPSSIAFIVGAAVACVTTFIVIPWLMPRLKAKGIVGRDLNKPDKPEVAEMGGIAVIIGFFAGLSVMLVMNGASNRDLLNVSLSAILGAAFIGMMDDLFDLRQRQKAFLPFVLALPLGAALDPNIYIPFIGEFDFGPWMIPAAAFAVTCAANAANMLEGFNGLGTGLGLIMAATLTALAFIHNRLDALFVLAPLMGAMAAFLWFNKYPAKVFPGDTMMLFLGATLAVSGLLSGLELQTIFIFIPMILEFGLKLRGHFRAENYCSGSSNGYLNYHGRIESVTHIFMKHIRLSERELVYILWGLEAAICLFVISVDLIV